MKPQGSALPFYAAAVIVALVVGVLLFQCRRTPLPSPSATVSPSPTPTPVRTVTPTPPFAVAAAINRPVAARASLAAMAAPGITPTPMALQDGKTIDYSSGMPVIRDSAQEKAIIDAAVKEMETAASGITFGPAAPTPAPTRR